MQLRRPEGILSRGETRNHPDQSLIEGCERVYGAGRGGPIVIRLNDVDTCEVAGVLVLVP
jgi:hypothetical protein